jgi:predicted DNA-binding transcriptional regulator AlpA
MTFENLSSVADSGHGIGLPETGLLRLTSILAPRGPIPVGKSTWWDGVKSGRFPQPVKLGPRVTAWRVEDIRALVDRGV